MSHTSDNTFDRIHLAPCQGGEAVERNAWESHDLDTPIELEYGLDEFDYRQTGLIPEMSVSASSLLDADSMRVILENTRTRDMVCIIQFNINS